MRPSDLDPDGHDLTVTHVADVLQVSKTSVYRYLEKNSFPHAYQLEADWRIPQADVIAYRTRRQREEAQG